MKKIWTPDGLQQGLQQSWVGKGESIINYNQGKATLVDKGKVGVDNQPSSVQENDDNVIAGNDVDWSNGMTFANQIAPMAKIIEDVNKAETRREKNANFSSLSKATQAVTDQEKQKVLAQMQEITNRQAAQHQYEKEMAAYGQYNIGKDCLPMFKRGKYNSNSKFDSSYKYEMSSADMPLWARSIPNLVGLGVAGKKYKWWKKNPITYHDTYSPNYNESRALQIMAMNRVSPYPAIKAAQDAERRGSYELNETGGLTGAQRYTGRMASALANAQNMANIYVNAEAQNTALRNQYAEALGKFGLEDATRRQNARQHDWADYVAAHGRKVKGIEQSLADIVGQFNNWYANDFKYRTFKSSADMYRQQLDDDQRKFIAQMRAAGFDKDGNKTEGSATTPQYSLNTIKTDPLRDAWFSRTNRTFSVPSYSDLAGGVKNNTNVPSTATPPYTSQRVLSTNIMPFGGTAMDYRFGGLSNAKLGSVNYYGKPFRNNFLIDEYGVGGDVQRRDGYLDGRIISGFGRAPKSINTNRFGMGYASFGDYMDKNFPQYTNYMMFSPGGFTTDPRSYNKGKNRRTRR